MQISWLSLLPPLAVLISAFITRKLNISLLLGIITGALIASDGSLSSALSLVIDRSFKQIIDIDYLYMYGFLILIGSLVIMISKNGGALSFAHAITTKVRSKVGVETSSMLLSSLLFMDDYLSSLTAGYVMRPLTDRFSIPRAKLAYLVHSLSGPLVILVPVSSWVAMITSQLESSGVGLDGSTARISSDAFFLYVYSIPCIFYSLLLIASVWFVVHMRISYGPMKEQERIASHTHNLFGGKPSITYKHDDQPNERGSTADLVLPLLVLVGAAFLGILYSGGYCLLGGCNDLITALRNNRNTFQALFGASLIAFIFSSVFGVIRTTVTARQLPSMVRSGFDLMKNAIIMVILASTLGTILKLDLNVGAYVAHLASGTIAPALLPVIFFIVSSIVSTVTGSSWGTIALMLPGTIQMLTTLLDVSTPASPCEIPLLLPVLGAIFSGAVCGDHISPISETTIMAATSSGAYPIDHTITQFFYALPAILGSLVAFTIAGYTASLGTSLMIYCSLGAGLCCTFGLLWLFNKIK